MEEPWKIVQIVPSTLADADWEQIAKLNEEIYAEINPGDPPPSRKKRKAFWISPHPLWRDQRWLAYDGDGELVGFCSLGRAAEDSPDYAEQRTAGHIYLAVRKAWRRQGLGTALLRTLVRAARVHGMQHFQGEFQLDCARAFWSRYGAVIASERTRNRLYMKDIDYTMLERWVEEGQARSPEARIEIYEEILPDELLVPYSEAYNRISAQTPDFENNELPLLQHTSPEDRRATEALVRDKNIRWVTMLCRAADGAIMGITEVFNPVDEAHFLDQDITGVVQQYRGRGIGKWLKAAMVLYAREHFPQAQFFETGNNNGNAPMLAINHRMGYKPHISEAIFHINLDPLAKTLRIETGERRPSLPLPEPLRASEQPSFTHYSVVTRLPEIAQRALQENPFPPETVARIQTLIDEIPYGKIRPAKIASLEASNWAAWTAPYLDQNWLEAPWFFVEEYFYLRMLEATGYFERGGPAAGVWYKRDPYAVQKRLGLESERERLRTLSADVEASFDLPAEDWPAALARLLMVDLWGNQSDLSLWPVSHKAIAKESRAASVAASAAAAEAHTPGSEMGGAELERVLSDDLEVALDFLAGRDPAQTRIDLLLDNAGYELAADLALADYLLAAGRAAQVTLHAKTYPVFVSDALVKDVHATLDYLLFEGQPETQAQAVRLRTRLAEGRLRITSHPFWTSPLAMWQIPEDLLDDLSGTALLISKGDANYRRLLGDRHWPQHLPFDAVIDYLPFAMLALRTLKSEITLGVPPERVPQADPKWMTNGRWGLIQFSQPAPR